MVHVATLALVDHREEMRETAKKMLEAETIATLSEAQALELLILQAEDSENALGQRVRIEVSNGNGVNRMARKVGIS